MQTRRRVAVQVATDDTRAERTEAAAAALGAEPVIRPVDGGPTVIGDVTLPDAFRSARGELRRRLGVLFEGRTPSVRVAGAAPRRGGTPRARGPYLGPTRRNR